MILDERRSARVALEAQGVRVATVSYDSQAVLANFAAHHSVHYPLLSDHDSAVIERFGILNSDMPKGHLFAGIPYPGNYLISPDGTVLDKVFLPDYQTRPSAGELLTRSFHTTNGPGVGVEAQDLRARISLSEEGSAPGQLIGVSLEIEIAPEWHVYGEPLPGAYVAARLEFGTEVAAELVCDWPEPELMRFETLGETLPVYEGSVRVAARVRVRSDLKSGPHILAGTLRYQMCSADVCRPPETAAFELPLEILPHAEAPRPVAPGS